MRIEAATTHPKHTNNWSLCKTQVRKVLKRAILIFCRKEPAITEHVEHVTKIIRLSFLIRSYIRSISRSTQPPKHFVPELKSHINLPKEKAGPSDGPGNTNERVPIAKVRKSTGKQSVSNTRRDRKAVWIYWLWMLDGSY